MINGFKKISVIALLAVIAVSFVVLQITQRINKPTKVVSPNDLNNNELSSGGLKKFTSHEELANFLSNLSQDTNDYRMAISKTESLATDAAPAGGDFSETNVQVEGVDEADMVKTDGKYIYTLSNNDLFIVKTGDLKDFSKISFESTPQEFYVSGNKLVVFGYDQRFYQTEMYQSFIRPNQFSFLEVYDLTNIESPKLVKDLSLEGSYVSSRLLGDNLYFVINNYSFYSPGGPLLPRIISETKEELALNPDIYYFDRPYQSANFVTVASLNLSNLDDIKESIYLTNPSQTIYMSEEALYLTDTVYQDSYELETRITKEIVLPLLSQADRDRISRIENVADDILNSWEKQNKIQQIVESYLVNLQKDELVAVENNITAKIKIVWPDFVSKYQQTFVYKIAIDNGNLNLIASTSVPGRVLNQFSLDEYQGYLRLATTRDQISSRFDDLNEVAINNIYILDDKMKIIGNLEGLAGGEQIYSARFLGDKAFVVTFKRTDPLLVIDLKDPKNPKLVGELKIPGFSTYLHPYSDKYLIGLGTDTKDLGDQGVSVGGIKLSLFDISDISQPKELDTYIAGLAGSYSVASNNHKAFLFSSEKNLLALPAQLTKKDYQADFNGVLVFSIENDAFKLRTKLAEESVQRVVYVKDDLYTISFNEISAYSINDLKKSASFKFPESTLPTPMPLIDRVNEKE